MPGIVPGPDIREKPDTGIQYPVGCQKSGKYSVRYQITRLRYAVGQIPDKKFDIRHETRYPTKNPARTGYIAELPAKYRISGWLVGYIIRFRNRLDGYPALFLDLISI